MDDPSIRDLTAYVLDLEDAIDRYAQDLEEAARLNDEFTLSAAWGIVHGIGAITAGLAVLGFDYWFAQGWDWIIRYPVNVAIFLGVLLWQSHKTTGQQEKERLRLDRLPRWERYKPSRPQWRNGWW